VRRENMEEKTEKMGEEEEVKSVKRVDVSKLVSIIPPPSELKREEKRITEKRIRIRYDESLQEDQAKLSKELAKFLGISEDDQVEIVVAGRKKFVFKPIVVDELDPNTVMCYPEKLRESGVADNSIATIRKYRGTGR